MRCLLAWLLYFITGLYRHSHWQVIHCITLLLSIGNIITIYPWNYHVSWYQVCEWTTWLRKTTWYPLGAELVMFGVAFNCFCSYNGTSCLNHRTPRISALFWVAITLPYIIMVFVSPVATAMHFVARMVESLSAKCEKYQKSLKYRSRDATERERVSLFFGADTFRSSHLKIEEQVLKQLGVDVSVYDSCSRQTYNG